MSVGKLVTKGPDVLMNEASCKGVKVQMFFKFYSILNHFLWMCTVGLLYTKLDIFFRNSCFPSSYQMRPLPLILLISFQVLNQTIL